MRAYGLDGKPFGLIAVPGGAIGNGVFEYVEFFHRQRKVDRCILSVHPDCLWAKAHGMTPEQVHQRMHEVAEQVRTLGILKVQLHVISNNGAHVNCAHGHAHLELLAANQ